MPSDILDTPDSAYELVSTKPGPAGALPLTDELLRHAPERRPLRLDAERRHGLEPASCSAARSSSSSARTAACAPTMARRSRSAITPGTGKSACS